MKTPNCSTCNDTGSTSKHMTGHLDCISCSAATDRVMLEAFIEDLPAMGERDKAWVIHQRALAMAPKQEAVKEYLSTQGEAPTIKENLIVPFAEAMSALNHVRTVAPMSYGRDPRDVLCAFINHVAAPAAANGAMPELPPPAFKAGRSYGIMKVDAWDKEMVMAYGTKRAEHAFSVTAEMIPVQSALASNSGSKNSSSCTAAADVDSLDAALQRAAGELPDGYTIRVEVELGAGGVEWSSGDAEGSVDHQESLASDVLQALEDAKEHAAAAGSAA